jgi:hypothetical protein
LFQVQNRLQFELYTSLNQPEQMTSMLGEPSHIAEERAQLKLQMSILDKAYTVLQRDPMITALQLEAVDDMDSGDDAHYKKKPSQTPPMAQGGIIDTMGHMPIYL